MRSKQSEIYRLLLLLTDLGAIAATWILAYFLRFHIGIETPSGAPGPELYMKLTPFILAIWALVTLISGSYQKIDTAKSRLGHLLAILQTSVLFILALVSFSYFYEEYRYSRLMLLIFSVMLPFSIILARSTTSRILVRYNLTRPKKNALLIASGVCLEDFFGDQIGNFEANIIGAIIPESSALESDKALCKKNLLPWLDGNQDWASFFTHNPCEQVIISLPHGLYHYLEKNLDQISDQVPDVKIIPDVLRYSRFNTGMDMIGNIPVIHIHESPLTGINCIIKRSMDIAGAMLAILIFSPIMAVISILVPLSSRGPILYRQVRMGLDGKTFNCLKFRSMPVGVESKTGAVWATAADNRATPFGSFIHKTSLDELPQLFNVLKGDMSLVGPRPERPVFVNDFRKKVPGYMLRHKVKTGITGWAQVNGWRGSTSIQRRIECDLYYIQNWSFWLDVKILLMTIEEVLIGKNAY